jgi:hypothetical protein
MCGCSNFVNNDEKEFITQDELNREFDFTGNRPSVIDFGNEDNFDFTGNRPSIIEVGEDPSFDFTGNRPSVFEVGEDPSFDFLGRNRRAKKDLRAQGLSRIEARDVVKGRTQAPQTRTETTTQTQDDINRTTYGQGDWFSRNLIWIVVGVAVIGGGFYIYKKRSK